jgi:hypothetical protein
MAIDPKAIVLLEGEMEAKWQTMQVFWKKRKFAIYADLSFRRFNGDIVRHSAIMTADTVVSKVDETEFTIAFGNINYRVRAPLPLIATFGSKRCVMPRTIRLLLNSRVRSGIRHG